MLHLSNIIVTENEHFRTVFREGPQKHPEHLWNPFGSGYQIRAWLFDALAKWKISLWVLYLNLFRIRRGKNFWWDFVGFAFE